MFKRRQDKAKLPREVELRNLPELTDEFDLKDLLTAAIVTPLPGVVKTHEGKVEPRVFVKILAADQEGNPVTHTYSFEATDLAMITNVLNSLSVMVIVNPQTVLDLMPEKTPASYGNGGYL